MLDSLSLPKQAHQTWSYFLQRSEIRIKYTLWVLQHAVSVRVKLHSTLTVGLTSFLKSHYNQQSQSYQGKWHDNRDCSYTRIQQHGSPQRHTFHWNTWISQLIQVVVFGFFFTFFWLYPHCRFLDQQIIHHYFLIAIPGAMLDATATNLTNSTATGWIGTKCGTHTFMVLWGWILRTLVIT